MKLRSLLFFLAVATTTSTFADTYNPCQFPGAMDLAKNAKEVFKKKYFKDPKYQVHMVGISVCSEDWAHKVLGLKVLGLPRTFCGVSFYTSSKEALVAIARETRGAIGPAAVPICGQVAPMATVGG